MVPSTLKSNFKIKGPRFVLWIGIILMLAGLGCFFFIEAVDDEFINSKWALLSALGFIVTIIGFSFSTSSKVIDQTSADEFIIRASNDASPKHKSSFDSTFFLCLLILSVIAIKYYMNFKNNTRSIQSYGVDKFDAFKHYSEHGRGRLIFIDRSGDVNDR